MEPLRRLQARHADHMTALSTAGDTGFAGLASEIRTDAYGRLAKLAVLYAIIYFLVITLEMFVIPRLAGQQPPDLAFHVTLAAVAIAFSLLVARLSAGQKLPPTSFVRLAITFEVVAALGISGNAWGWEQLTDPTAWVPASVPWVGAWVLGFHSLLPLAPRSTLLGSLAAVLTLPAVHAVSIAVHGVPGSLDGQMVGTWSSLTSSRFVPGLICAVVAYVAAQRSYRLARAMTDARRLGSYQLDELLGRGGMGEVWKARHSMLARPAAVKLIRPERLGVVTVAGDRDRRGRPAAGGASPFEINTLLRRFEREAQATSALHSPHTVRLYDFGVADDGTFYYVMELLEGLDLESMVERFGPVPAPRATYLLRQACRSLAEAHARGMVHRDIKPANIYTCRVGLDFDFVKILDFGLVKDARTTPGPSGSLTADGLATGTPAFLPPEIALGERAIDGRADLYALGCVAYWLLTGLLVFEGDNPMQMVIDHARKPPVPPSERTELEVPADLERLIMSCLAKDPADRPPDALTLERALAACEASRGWSDELAAHWWETHLPERCAGPVDTRQSTAAVMPPAASDAASRARPASGAPPVPDAPRAPGA
jgi:serine/threonine-protein kinase